MKETTDGIQWYAIQLGPQCEKLVAMQLRNKGYEEYLPMYRSRRRWSDRVKEIQLPLFAGYIFCKFDVMHGLPIVVTPGVISIVGYGKMPLAIPEQEITAVQRIVNSPYAICTVAFTVCRATSLCSIWAAARIGGSCARNKEHVSPHYLGHAVVALGLGADRQRQHCPHRRNQGEEGRSVMGPRSVYSV